MPLKLILFIILIIFIIHINNKQILSSQEETKMNQMIKMIILRGLINPNCYWMNQSDKILLDKSGVNTFKLIKSRTSEPFVPLNILNIQILLVTDINYIEKILQNSPNPFNVGKLKYQFFKSFMKHNLGVSQGKEWKRRRFVNEEVLYLNRVHELTENINYYIKDLVNNNNFHVFKDFLYASQKLATKIVFNQEEIAKDIFNFFAEVNNIKHYTERNYIAPKELENKYFAYMKKNINNPVKNSLISIAKRHETNITELSHQIPHWVFPIAAIVNSIVPRTLLLLLNHKDKLNKVMIEINENFDENNWTTLFSLKYLRKCILEILRLNNNVVSLFRTLESNFKFDDKYSFQKGTQFAIFTNPILRSNEYFEKADHFYPERWTSDLELKYLPAISFSRGNQKCPGKDLTFTITICFLTHLLKKIEKINPNLNVKTNSINILNIPHSINPCKINFDY